MRRKVKSIYETHTVNYFLNSDDINDDKQPELIQLLLTNNIKFETYDGEYGVDFFDDLEIEVDFTYVPSCKGARGEYGEPMEPDYPETFEDLCIYVTTKNDRIDITEYLDNVEKISEEIMCS